MEYSSKKYTIASTCSARCKTSDCTQYDGPKKGHRLIAGSYAINFINNASIEFVGLENNDEDRLKRIWNDILDKEKRKDNYKAVDGKGVEEESSR